MEIQPPLWIFGFQMKTLFFSGFCFQSLTSVCFSVSCCVSMTSGTVQNRLYLKYLYIKTYLKIYYINIMETLLSRLRLTGHDVRAHVTSSSKNDVLCLDGEKVFFFWNKLLKTKECWVCLDLNFVWERVLYVTQRYRTWRADCMSVFVHQSTDTLRPPPASL